MAATHLHFDCTYGISGDMILGALVDLGLSIEQIGERLKGLPIGPFQLRAEPIKRQGIMGSQVRVEVEEDHLAHRHLKEVLSIVEAAGLTPRAARRAAEAFGRLASAEAHVHGSTVDKIHFHEVGAKDAILDITGAMVGIELLGVETFSASPVAVGSGTVHCRHGVMPVPAPATAELLQGIAQVPGDIAGELATPTGVAILSVLLDANPTGDGSGSPISPPLVAERIGYGSGTRVIKGHTNFLRLMLCQSQPMNAAQTVVVLETEIDDMSPEVAGYLMERLLEDGAHDVQFSPVQMKKNRPGLRVRVLGASKNERKLAERILRETSTFGLRRQVVERWCLDRRSEQVQTPWGAVEVKVGLWEGRVIKVSPEYESCAAKAAQHHLALAEVYDSARAAIRDQYGSSADSKKSEAT